MGKERKRIDRPKSFEITRLKIEEIMKHTKCKMKKQKKEFDRTKEKKRKKEIKNAAWGKYREQEREREYIN